MGGPRGTEQLIFVASCQVRTWLRAGCELLLRIQATELQPARVPQPAFVLCNATPSVASVCCGFARVPSAQGFLPTYLPLNVGAIQIAFLYLDI
jgi:hypothetical protein